VAIFNPDVPNTDADYTQASKGYRPDMSTASLFEDIGNIYTAGVKAADTLFKAVIREEATEGVDAIRDREINMGAQQQGYGTQPPKEIDTAATRLGTMKAAKDSGQVGDSHYMLLLDSEARRLRSRYPGHREYIDNVIQDLTGTTPANRAVDLLKAELTKTGTKDTEMANQMHWARQNGGAGADYVNESLRMGQQPDLNKLTVLNTAHGKFRADLEDASKKLTINKGTREERESATEKTVTSLLSQHLDNQQRAASAASGMTYEKLQATREELGKTKPTAQQEEQLRLQVDQYVNEQNVEFDKFMKQIHTDSEGKRFTWGSELTPEAMTRARKNFQDKLKDQVDPLLNKDYAAIARNQAYAEAKVSENVRKLVDIDIAARQAAYKKVLGDQSFQFFSSTSGDALKAQQKTFRDFIIGGVANPRQGSLQDDINKIRDIAKQDGIPDKDVVQAQKTALDDMVKHIKEQKSDPKVVEAYAMRLFDNREGKKDWYANASPGTREYLYEQLMQPGVVAAVTAPGVNPQVMDNYYKWVDAAAADRMSGPKSQTATLSQMLDRGTFPYTVNFDPATGMFKAVPNPLNPRPVSASVDQGALRTATQLAEEMSRTTRGLVPVAEARGFNVQNVTSDWVLHMESRGLTLGPNNDVVSMKHIQSTQGVRKNSGISTEPSGTSEQPKSKKMTDKENIDQETVRTSPNASEQRPTFGLPPEAVRPGVTTQPKTSNQFTVVTPPDDTLLEDIRKEWLGRNRMGFKGTGNY
jgi:hypothetical protein